MWFIGVEVEQETSAPPSKKNPGSAPVRHPHSCNPTHSQQVWLYLIRRTMRPAGYVGTTKNLQIVLNTPQNPYLNQATRKLLPNFPSHKNPRIENFNTKKIH